MPFYEVRRVYKVTETHFVKAENPLEADELTDTNEASDKSRKFWELTHVLVRDFETNEATNTFGDISREGG